MSEEQTMVDGYQLINCIASGNDTQVWEAVEGSRRVALKLMLPEAKKEREKVAVLKAEAKAGKLFEHPNIIKVDKLVINKKYAYLVMDYFRASNLKNQIHNDLYGVQLRMKKLVESVCSAMVCIHDRGWVHRDLKPDNILMNRGSEVRVIDFSLAMKIKKFGKMKEIQGTKSYIAPETLLRKGPTPQTDMYSLGVTLFLALTGELPITGLTPQDLLKNHLTVIPATPSSINPNVTPEMDEFVLRLLAKKPQDRFKTMDEAFSTIRGMNIFKEKVEDVEARRKDAEAESLRDGVDAARRLDSRSDAARTEMLGGKGAEAKPWNDSQRAKQKPQPPKPAKPPVSNAPPAPVANPAAAQMPPGMAGYAPQQLPPGMPPQYHPGMPMPPYGGAPTPAGYPGMPMPQAYPGMPTPQQGMPGAYPGAVPGQPIPPQQMPAQPQPPAAAQPVPATTPPAPATPPKPTPPPEPANNDDDLPFMDELPDVL